MSSRPLPDQSDCNCAIPWPLAYHRDDCPRRGSEKKTSLFAWLRRVFT